MNKPVHLQKHWATVAYELTTDTQFGRLSIGTNDKSLMQLIQQPLLSYLKYVALLTTPLVSRTHIFFELTTCELKPYTSAL